LPYRGLGSGIKRALEKWPEIDFADGREGCLFNAKVHRKKLEGAQMIETLPVASGKTSGNRKSHRKTGRAHLRPEDLMPVRHPGTRMGR
jgi:hypothetical protein